MANRGVSWSSALLLLAVFLFPYFALAAGSEDSSAALPPCCRAQGAHHCVRMRHGVSGDVGHQRGHSLRAAFVSERCSCTAPADTAVGHHEQSSLPLSVATTTPGGFVWRNAVQHVARASGQHGCHPSRGPPKTSPLA